MSPKRTRRSAEERIEALKAEIERIKTRAAESKVKKDPALRHISGAVRSLDKALTATKDAATRTALAEARTTLTACLSLHGANAPSGTGRVGRTRRAGAPAADEVLAYLRKHPGSRSEEMAAELGTDTGALRPVLHQLRDDGRLRVDGKARATRYTALGR
jgi:hypothetical protein